MCEPKMLNANTGKSMWFSDKAVKTVKHRHKIFRKYNNPFYPACNNANSQASRAVYQSQ